MLQPSRCLLHRLGVEPEPVFPSLDGALHQAGPLQHLHMLGDPVERNGEPLRQRPHVGLSFSQYAKDGSTGRICKCAIDLVQHGVTRAREGLDNINHQVE